ncbi:hypothetical protein CR513_53993, partial [Mucuna pruriens]
MPLKIYCDNNLAVLYSNNNRSSTKSKFIDIKFLVVKEIIFIKHIGCIMLVDPLTKGLIPFMSTLLIWEKFSTSLYQFVHVHDEKKVKNSIIMSQPNANQPSYSYS